MNKKIFIIISLIFTGILGLFFLSPTQQNHQVIILDADQLVDKKESFYGKELRVRGFVKPGSILRFGNTAEFIITHNQKELPVYFNGKTQIPDTFADAAPVRIDGVLKSSGQFVAHKIEAKCASKYEVNEKMKIDHSQLKYEQR